MVTHLVFGAGSAALLPQLTPVGGNLYAALVLSLLVNPAIDWLGHFRKGQHISRSPLTHSVFTAPVWGAAMGYLVWWSQGWWGSPGYVSVASLVEVGVLVALAHLLLDSMTERGVFLLGGRIALAHFRSGNALLNGAFIALGAGLFLAQALRGLPA